MGLGTWAALTKGEHNEAMMMGDTVLFEDEVDPIRAVFNSAAERGAASSAEAINGSQRKPEFMTECSLVPAFRNV